MINITHSQSIYTHNTPMQYISVKGDIIEVNTYPIQLFHRVECIWFNGQIQTMALSVGGIDDCICAAS